MLLHLRIAKVEDTVFRVPREGFEKSSTFCELYGIESTCSEEPAVKTGNGFDDVVVIKDVTANEFSAFLKLLISPYVAQTLFYVQGLTIVCANRPCGFGKFELSDAELESALKLSSMWKFEAIRLTAISRFEALLLEPARTIYLAHLYDVNHWIAPAIERLIFRPESLSADELLEIGFETAAEIIAHRDMKSFISLDIVKEHFTSQDAARVHTCIADNIKKRRGDFTSVVELPEIVPSLISEGQAEVGPNDDISAETNATACEQPLTNRFDIQEALDKLSADREALENRIASLQIQSEEVGFAEERMHHLAKVAQAESNVEKEKSNVLSAKVSLAETTMGSPVKGKKGPSEAEREARRTTALAVEKLRDAETQLETARERLRLFDSSKSKLDDSSSAANSQAARNETEGLELARTDTQ